MPQWKQSPTLIFLFLIFGFTANAQDYRPFNPFQTAIFRCSYNFYYEPNRVGRYSLRVESGSQQGANTVFSFNRIAANKEYGANAMSINQDNVFGKKMIQKPGGVYQFITSDPDTFLIQTQVPPQTTWTFNAKTGVTARLVNKQWSAVVGSLMDSVVYIRLSSGKDIFISKNYGLIKADPFKNLSFKDYTHTGPFELRGVGGIGESLPSFDELYDFHPGETFFRINTRTSWEDCTKIYIREKILTREFPNSTGGITFTYERTRVQIDIYPGPPNGTVRDTSLYGPDTLVAVHPNRHFFSTHHFSNEVNGLSYLAGPFIMSEWNNRKMYRIEEFQYIDSVGRLINYDDFNSRDIAEGIGLVHFGEYHVETELVCYEKLTDSLGQCFSIETLVSNEPGFPELDIKVFPNPTSNLLNIEWPIQSKPIEISLIDISGKTIYQTSSTQTQVEINAQNFPSGIYFLKMMMDGKMIKTKRVSIVK